ncbi:MAG: ROK family protein [Petrimonas sp.]|jgi:glucokinase
MENENTVIGIDIGGTKISAALFTCGGEILLKNILPVANKKGYEVIDLIEKMVSALIEHANNDNLKVSSIGVCVPGIYNPTKKTVWAPNISGWDHISLYEELKKRINNSSIKVFIDSDRSCYILGEIWKGAAKDCTDAIFISVGTGIGVGILSGNQILRGKSGISGAVGWVALEPPFKDKYKTCGNFEYYASGNGIARSAVELLRDYENETAFKSIPLTQLTSYDVFRAYGENDPVAIKVIDKAILYWGMAVANLVSIFNPEKVIFGGGIFGPAARFINRIKKEAEKWAQPLSIKETSIEISALGGDAGLIGAGYLAIKSIKEK